jgi:hypothetical protein
LENSSRENSESLSVFPLRGLAASTAAKKESPAASGTAINNLPLKSYGQKLTDSKAGGTAQVSARRPISIRTRPAIHEKAHEASTMSKYQRLNPGHSWNSDIHPHSRHDHDNNRCHWLHSACFQPIN